MGKFEDMIKETYGTLQEQDAEEEPDNNDEHADQGEIKAAKDAAADPNDPNHQDAVSALQKKEAEDKKNIKGLQKATQ